MFLNYLQVRLHLTRTASGLADSVRTAYTFQELDVMTAATEVVMKIFVSLFQRKIWS